MNHQFQHHRNIRCAVSGQTMVEYALLLVAIALTVVLGLGSMGQNTKHAVKSTSSILNPGSITAGGGGGTGVPGAT